MSEKTSSSLKGVPSAGSLDFPVPDVRFEQTFMRSLKREAENQRTRLLLGLNIAPDEIAQIQNTEPAKITNSVIAKVIIKDVLVMPFLQGVFYTAALLAVRPWLRSVVINGRAFGTTIYNRITGGDLIVSKSK